MKTGQDIKATLDIISRGENYYDIWNLLPEVASGTMWQGEIKDCASRIMEYLEDGKEYDLDDLRDWGGEFANLECEDYYSNINRRVQNLDLWASDELDAEVTEIVADDREMTLTKLQGIYLYYAMRQLWDAVADQAYINTDETEEEGE